MYLVRLWMTPMRVEGQPVWIGYVSGVGAAPYDEPRGNLTGDPYFTDGLRVVMWVSHSPKSLSELKIMDLGVQP